MLDFKVVVKSNGNCNDRAMNLESWAPEADALSIRPPELMASRAKSVTGLRVPRKTTRHGRDTAETWPRHGRDTAETRPRHGRDTADTRSTQGLRKVYAGSTPSGLFEDNDVFGFIQWCELFFPAESSGSVH